MFNYILYIFFFNFNVKFKLSVTKFITLYASFGFLVKETERKWNRNIEEKWLGKFVTHDL